MTKRIRVLVVEDSLTARRLICEALSADPDLEVVGEASDGKRAIELCEILRPDVITMDMMLPVMSGLAATEYIMAHFPTPILIVSASLNRGELFKTYEALAAGALDVLEKPNGAEVGAQWEQRLTDAVKLLSRIKVITHLRGRRKSAPESPPAAPATRAQRDAIDLIAIGASTGGPAAILELLKALPQSFALPILFVLHIDEQFSASFAEWLDGQTKRRVSYARDGDPLASANGRVVMARPGLHLTIAGDRLRLVNTAPRHSCRPSIDVLFESIAKERGASTAACLLTGMGRDGAAGLLAIRQAGGLTVAQDEASSVVYGMPREAALIGGAGRVLPLDEIAPWLISLKRREDP